jgi:hypothetical protein
MSYPHRPDLQRMGTAFPSLLHGAVLLPLVLWRRDAWMGVLFDGFSQGKVRLGPRLALQLAPFYPPLVVEPMTRPGPLAKPGLLGEDFAGYKLSSGDAPFDADFSAASPHPSFGQAFLDPEGRALLRRLRGAGAAAMSISGRIAMFLLGDVSGEPAVVAMFDAVEACLTHLTRLPPLARPPDGLCHLCGYELRGAVEHCEKCGGRFHHHCHRSYGGCPLPSCAPTERIVAGIVRFATTGPSWSDAAETRPARPEHFGGAGALARGSR